MGLFIFVLLCILAIKYPKSRLITGLILVFMWILYSFNTYSGDYANYKYIYERICDRSYYTFFEPGYTLLMIICYKLGFSFIGFRTLLGTFFTFLLYKIINKYTNMTALALGLFLIFPFMYFASVLRSGIAYLIVAYSINFLYRQKKDVYKYIGGIIVAMLFHYSAIFFLIFLFAKKEMRTKKYVFLVMLVVFIGLIVNYSDIILNVVSQFTERRKVLKWLSKDAINEHLNWKGMLCEIVVVFGNIYVMWISKDILNRKSFPAQSVNREFMRNMTISYNANIIIVLILPFILLSTVYIRYVWGILILNICTYCNVVEQIKIKHQHYSRWQISLYEIMVIIWTIMLHLYSDRPYAGTENAGLLMLQNNLIFH